MSLLSLIAVFLLEQLQPLNYRRVVAEPLGAWAGFVERRLNAGQYSNGVLAWCLTVAAPVLLVGLLYAFLESLNPVFGLLLNIGVLYLTMGFRQFSHHYTEIQLALRQGDLDRARHLLAVWQERPTAGLGAEDIARLSIEGALAASHRHVFAVLLWFVLLPGPCGAVLYRFSGIVRECWQKENSVGHNEFPIFSRQAFALIDWVALRTTALVFAIVGDFEDAVHCWRTQPANWPDQDLGIVLASGAGALGVRLGQPVIAGGELADRAELGVGDPADQDFMQSAVGLVWRATVLWVLLLFLLGLASLVS